MTETSATCSSNFFHIPYNPHLVLFSTGEFFPKHVGLPMEENPKQEKYYMLEVHYDNPSLREGERPHLNNVR